MTTTKTQTKTTTAAKATGKVRWTVLEVHNNGKDQVGTGTAGTMYSLTRNENGQFVAATKPAKGKLTEIGTGSFGQAYWMAVEHNKKAAEAANKRAAAGEARKAANAAKKAAVA